MKGTLLERMNKGQFGSEFNLLPLEMAWYIFSMLHIP